MPDPIVLDGSTLTLLDLERYLAAPEETVVRIDPDACRRVEASRRAVEAILERGQPVYGINTGFGRLADRRIEPNRLRDLQRNLVRSHAAGVGKPLGDKGTRLVLLLRANALAKGFSGIRLQTLESLVALLNHKILPVIPERGSVGASGDLAPLAHVALALIGEGEVTVDGERQPAAQALGRAGLQPVALEAKEGLSLVNGTQMMTAIGGRTWLGAMRLARTADILCALSLDALKGTDAAFDPRLHRARPHPGQVQVARNLGRLLRGSQVRESHRSPEHCPKVQDAYSLRCAPQVHGAVRDSLEHIGQVLEREINAATDNPLIFAEQGGVAISGGNFHGEPVAIVLDLLAIAAAELAAISERRIERLVNPDYSDLPAFLLHGDEGLHSGFMMAQVTAAALVSENKILAHPASVDSIPTSAGFEDHVSMGVTAALKARRVVQNAEAVLAVELLCAAQAAEFHRPLTTSPPLEAVIARLRAEVPTLDADRPLSPDIARAITLIEEGAVLAAAEDALGSPVA